MHATRPDAIVDSLPNVYDIPLHFGVTMPGPLGFVHLDLPTKLRAAGAPRHLR